MYNWRAGVSQLNWTMGMIFVIYIYHGQCHTANRLRVSKLTQLTIFHRRCIGTMIVSRRCAVATVQDEANPSSSQPAASCCVASESTEAHRDGRREYMLAGESAVPQKQPRRKKGVYLNVELATEHDVRPAQPVRHATSRCDTCSATSGDWRLKHLS